MTPVRDPRRVAPLSSAPLVDSASPPARSAPTATVPVDQLGIDAGPASAATPGKRRWRFRRSLLGEFWRWSIVAVVFLVLASVMVAGTLIIAIYWQARTDQTRPVDAIVVLGTAQFNGRPGTVLRARLDRAIDAYTEGVAPLIVVTGGRQPGDQFTEAEAAQGYLIDRGVPANAILLENEGQDSWTSMQGVAAVLAARDRSRVLLVSDGFHLLRVKLMARDLGLSAFAAPATASPIRPGGPSEIAYVVREAAGIVVHLWRTR